MTMVTHDTTSLAPRQHDPLPPAPRLQFRLRTLLAGVVVLSLVLATINRLGTVWSAVAIWSLLLVAAHVLGNVWGTRAARRRIAADPQRDDFHVSSGSLPYAPATQLSTTGRLGWTTAVATSGGALAGGALGLAAYLAHPQFNVSLAGLALATLSCAVLGGLLGFLASSFAKVFSRAWKQAARRKVSR